MLQTIPWPDMRDPSIAAVRGDRQPGSVWLYREEGESFEDHLRIAKTGTEADADKVMQNLFKVYS